MAKKSKTTIEVFKEVWPKLLIFTIMLLIVVFQKSPEKMKSLGQTDEQVKKQMESGIYETMKFESGPFTAKALQNLMYGGIMLVIYLIIKRKNDQAEEEEEKKKELEEEEEQYPGVKTFKKWKNETEANDKKKKAKESKFWNKFKKDKKKSD